MADRRPNVNNRKEPLKEGQNSRVEESNIAEDKEEDKEVAYEVEMMEDATVGSVGREKIEAKDIELKKQIYCSIRLINKTYDNVAFKVKTTSPKKYCVRPNTGIISPDGSCDVVVTMQAQSEAPPDMQCKDKFLVQSVVVPTGFTVEDFTNDMFNKESGKEVFEEKLKVQYIQPAHPPPILEAAKEDLSPRSLQQNGDRSFSPNEPVSNEEGELKVALAEAQAAVVRLVKEKNVALQRTQQLQKEVESLALKITEKGSSETVRVVHSGFSFLFVLLIGMLGILLGYLLRS